MFNIVYILVKFVMIIIFLFLHHSIMLCESEVLTYQGIVKHRILIFIHFQLDFQYDKICFQHRDGGLSDEKINDIIVIAILYHCC